MTLPQTDNDLFELAQVELSSCLLGDVMDKMRTFHQFLPPQIRPLNPAHVLIGRAMTVLSGDVFEESIPKSKNAIMEKPFGLMLEALDDLRPNEIYINTGSSPRNALWGEMMTIRARQLGARGVILNGYTRDTKAVLRMDFPAFAFGSYGQDSAPRYKVHDFRIPIEIGGVRINPGDLIFGDIDGVCVVPSQVESDVLRLAFEKARGEQRVRTELARGVSAVEAFRTHGIM